jgi:hypothetical protein
MKDKEKFFQDLAAFAKAFEMDEITPGFHECWICSKGPSNLVGLNAQKDFGTLGIKLDLVEPRIYLCHAHAQKYMNSFNLALHKRSLQ